MVKRKVNSDGSHRKRMSKKKAHRYTALRLIFSIAFNDKEFRGKEEGKKSGKKERKKKLSLWGFFL